MPALGVALGVVGCSMEAGVALVPGGGVVLQQGVAWPMLPSAVVGAPVVAGPRWAGAQVLCLRPSCSSVATATLETLLRRLPH